MIAPLTFKALGAARNSRAGQAISHGMDNTTWNAFNTLELDVIREESRRAGIPYTHHPRYDRHMAENSGRLGDKGVLPNVPTASRRAVRLRNEKMVEPFLQPEPLDILLRRHPEAREMWRGVSPEKQRKI